MELHQRVANERQKKKRAWLLKDEMEDHHRTKPTFGLGHSMHMVKERFLHSPEKHQAIMKEAAAAEENAKHPKKHEPKYGEQIDNMDQLKRLEERDEQALEERVTQEENLERLMVQLDELTINNLYGRNDDFGEHKQKYYKDFLLNYCKGTKDLQYAKRIVNAELKGK